jgi:hypothetical protein
MAVKRFLVNSAELRTNNSRNPINCGAHLAAMADKFSICHCENAFSPLK